MRLHPTWLILAGVACSPLLAGCSSSATPAGQGDGTAGSGASSGAGAAGASGSGTAGIGGSAGSTSGAGGSAGSSAGASGSGATSGTGTGGASGSGTGGVSGSGATSGAGAAGVAGGIAGSAGSAGAAGAGGCAATDQNGKANWSPGASTSTTQDYLRQCDIRLINNNWGSAAFGCSAATSAYSVFVNADGSFGWNFKRGDCDTGNTNQKPDFPELEFGVHPFGNGNSLATTPNFSSTTLLPLQIKDITSASVKVNNMTIALQQSGSWDITFELWLSQRNPLTDPSPGVYAELMTFWGWQNGRYPEPPNGTGPVGTGAGTTVPAGAKTYKLEVQSDTWANGQWRYFQFRTTDGPLMTFNGTVDVKKLLDYLVNTKGYSSDYWVSRFEVGSEIDDLTQGTVTMKGVTFEVNGQTRTAGAP